MKYLVSGKVQGVFFRASTREKARSLNLTGWAKNLDDGRVEVLACGEQSGLSELEAWLWQGPKFADVSEVITEVVTDVRPMDEFRIGY